MIRFFTTFVASSLFASMAFAQTQTIDLAVAVQYQGEEHSVIFLDVGSNGPSSIVHQVEGGPAIRLQTDLLSVSEQGIELDVKVFERTTKKRNNGFQEILVTNPRVITIAEQPVLVTHESSQGGISVSIFPTVRETNGNASWYTDWLTKLDFSID